jgi:hypothetical protein
VSKTAAQFSSFWKQAIFTGKGTPPKAFASEAELIKFVGETPGAIGYVTTNDVPATVKVITIK